MKYFELKNWLYKIVGRFVYLILVNGLLIKKYVLKLPRKQLKIDEQKNSDKKKGII